MLTARKHIGWAVRGLPGGSAFRDQMNMLQTCEAQIQALSEWFDQLAESDERLPQHFIK